MIAIITAVWKAVLRKAVKTEAGIYMVLYQFCGLTGTLASAGIVSLSISVCIVHTLCLFELLKVLSVHLLYKLPAGL